MKQSQLSFDLINTNVPNLDELAAKENNAIIDFLKNPDKWPENKVYLQGLQFSGIETLAKNFKKEGNNIFEITQNSQIDEGDLFAKIIEAEAQKNHLLIYSEFEIKELKIKSADLKSRIDGIMCLKMRGPNLEILTNIFAKWAHSYGIIIKKNDIKMLLNTLKIDFVINYKLIEYIKDNYEIGAKLSKSEITKIIKDFEVYILGQSRLNGC